MQNVGFHLVLEAKKTTSLAASADTEVKDRIQGDDPIQKEDEQRNKEGPVHFLPTSLQTWQIRKAITTEANSLTLKRLERKATKRSFNPEPDREMAKSKNKKNSNTGEVSNTQPTHPDCNKLALLDGRLKAVIKENERLKAQIKEMNNQFSKQGQKYREENTPSCSTMEVEPGIEQSTDDPWYVNSSPITNDKSFERPNKPTTQNNKKMTTKTNQSNSTNRGEQTSQNPKPPPINVFNCEQKRLNSSLSKNNSKLNYNIKRINNGKAAIHTNNSADHKGILTALVNNDINHFLYTRKEDKKLTWMIKGVSPEYTADEILQELTTISPKDVQISKVSKFTTRVAEREGRQLPMYVVQTTPKSNTQSLLSIRSIFHQLISWDKLKRNETIQCHRCQRLGHAASNCKMNYRCVKCKIDHSQGNCSV